MEDTNSSHDGAALPVDSPSATLHQSPSLSGNVPPPSTPCLPSPPHMAPSSPSQHFPATSLAATQLNIHDDTVTSLQSSNFVLHLGCDSCEDEEEENLRNFTGNKEDLLFPAAISELKFCDKFSLTPTQGKKDLHCDLITPLQDSKARDCPERPIKMHRSSTSHLESSTSCRLLFSATAPAIGEVDDSHHHHHHHHASNQWTPPRPQDVVPSPPPLAAKPSLGVKLETDNLPTPIHSPSSSSSSSSSSSCSDCVVCSSSDVSSPCITSHFPLSSPVMTGLRPASQTLISSPDGEAEQVSAVEMALDLPPVPQQPQLEREQSLAQPESSKASRTVASGEREVPVPVVRGRQGCDAALETEQEPGETSLAPSSTGSVHSNWTVISGISPLPSSDSSRLHHNHNHHHHHHHHHHERGHHHKHHRHHHHHHHHHRHELGSKSHGRRHASTDENYSLVTSTPIHSGRCVGEVMDVSAVTSSYEGFSEARFVVSSEISSPELSDSLRGHFMSLPVPLQAASSTHAAENIARLKRPKLCHRQETVSGKRKERKEEVQEDGEKNCDEGEEDLENFVRRKDDSKKKGSKESCAESKLDNEEQWKKVKVQEGSKEHRDETEIEEGRSGQSGKKGSLPFSVDGWSSWSWHCASLGSRPARCRLLSKGETREVKLTPINISERFLMCGETSSPVHSSTFDESLFRAVHLEPRRSVTLE